LDRLKVKILGVHGSGGGKRDSLRVRVGGSGLG